MSTSYSGEVRGPGAGATTRVSASTHFGALEGGSWGDISIQTVPTTLTPFPLVEACVESLRTSGAAVWTEPGYASSVRRPGPQRQPALSVPRVTGALLPTWLGLPPPGCSRPLCPGPLPNAVLSPGLSFKF